MRVYYLNNKKYFIKKMNQSGWDTILESSNFDYKELTNNSLYLIFVGYLLPLLSPKS